MMVVVEDCSWESKVNKNHDLTSNDQRLSGREVPVLFPSQLLWLTWSELTGVQRKPHLQSRAVHDGWVMGCGALTSRWVVPSEAASVAKATTNLT